MHVRHRRRGFTLVEVILVCAVLVLVATITIPTLRGMYPSFKVNGAVDFVPKADTVVEAGDEVLVVLDPGLEAAITAQFVADGDRPQ